jgi:hydrogenase 3 maturation protease
MSNKEYDFKQKLEKWLKKSKNIVIAGIGNPIRSDDFIGVKIIQELKNKVPPTVTLYECETIPESFIQPIIELNPTHVLLIDAAYMGTKIGKAKLVKPEKILNYSPVTSHTLPLRVFCELLKKTTKSKIALLLIEPKNTDFGEKISLEVQEMANNVIMFLIDFFKK